MNSLEAAMEGMIKKYIDKPIDTIADKESLIMNEDGVFKVVNNDIGKFIYTISSFGLGDTTPGVKMKLPLIPMCIYHFLFGLFKRVQREYKSEAAAYVYYNTSDKKYFVYVPEQVVSGVVCVPSEFDEDIEEIEKTCIRVLDVHSHHCMPSVPSSTDIKTQVLPYYIYGIMGNFSKKDDYSHSSYFLIGDGNLKQSVPLSQIFDTTEINTGFQYFNEKTVKNNIKLKKDTYEKKNFYRY